MTIKITVECDGDGCTDETEISDNYDSAVESEGWAVDPEYGGQHFCPACWIKIKKLIDTEE